VRADQGEVRNYADVVADPELDQHVCNTKDLTVYLSDPQHVISILRRMNSQELMTLLRRPTDVTDADELRRMIMDQWHKVNTACVAAAEPTGQGVHQMCLVSRALLQLPTF